MRQRVEMADIVAFEFEARAAAFAEPLEDAFDIGEGVLEDRVAGGFQQFWLPGVLPVARAVEHGEKAEIHRAHVERAHLRLAASGAARRSPASCREEPPVVMLMTASVACLMRGRNCMKTAGSAVGRPSFRVAGVQMQDRGAGLRRRDRLLAIWSGVSRQMRRHRRRVDRAGDGAGDDDLAVCHASAHHRELELGRQRSERASRIVRFRHLLAGDDQSAGRR
jgi:hypothetical protein